MSGYGTLAITADAWTNARAQEILTNGLPPLPSVELRRFDPAEHRDNDGKWTAGAAGAAKDVLKIAEKIDLGKDEKLIASDKLNTNGGNIRVALTEVNGVKSLRLGIGGEGFGTRHDGAGPWTGNRDKSSALEAERNKLRDELVHLDSMEHRTPAQQKRFEELDSMDLSENGAAGFTAKLDDKAAAQLAKKLTSALGVGKKVKQQIDDLEAKGLPEPERPPQGFWTIEQGTIHGEWADIQYDVYLDDLWVGVETHIAAVPHGSGRDLSDLTGNEQGARLDAADAEKFTRLLNKFVHM
jgi:hypothetical protein